MSAGLDGLLQHPVRAHVQRLQSLGLRAQQHVMELAGGVAEFNIVVVLSQG